MERLFAAWSRMLERLFPDPFTLSLLLTLATLMVALLLTPFGLSELIGFWGDGLWSFLGFAMQMGLILVTGQALAEATLVARALRKIASAPKNMGQAAGLVSFCAMTAAWLNWGFGLIVGAILARQVADAFVERLGGEEHVSRGLLGAAGYTGLAFWHGGISGSSPLAVAQPGHSFEDLCGVIPMAETVFSVRNLGLSLALLVLVPAFLVLLSHLGIATKNQPVAPLPQQPASQPVNVAEKILVLVMTVLAVVWWVNFSSGLGLNTVIFAFLFLGLLAHGSASRYAGALDRATGSISGIVLQFPFYAGIIGIASKSGLVEVVSGGFVSASEMVSRSTGFQPFLLFVFLSAGLANLFVPSGGGQWMIQGPIVLTAATKLQLDHASAVMAVSYGDQWTNLLQPFWALPLLSITGLKPAQLLSVTTLLLLFQGVIVCLFLAFFH